MGRSLALLAALASISIANADMTGMVPGDVVVDNITADGPGHAGIYIGRWSMLPKDLQSRYSKALDEAAVRSGVPEILDSYLVVDSMPGRGVRVAPMVEQFSDYHGGTNAYYPQLKKFDLVGAQRFENDKGVAVKWDSLPDKDPRRWKIVEMALECAEAHVPYDDKHGQLATTTVGEMLRSAAGGSGLQLDCIAFCHFVYWKAAQIDLDVSMMPFHAPSQIYDYAKAHQMWRPVSFLPLVRDAAYLGTWKPTDVSVNTSGLDKEVADAAQSDLGWFGSDERFRVRREAADFTFTLSPLDRGKADGDPIKLSLDKTAVSPIQAGCASGVVEDKGNRMSVRFTPFSSELATMTMLMTDGGKQVKITVMLQRERSVRKLIR